MQTVLVVDNETGILVLVQQLMEEASFTVYTAGDAEEALALLSAHPFDVLLVDLHLSDMDGLELVQRARDQQPEIAIVTMTGYKSVDSIVRAVRLGIDGIVLKPGEINSDLASIIQQSLAHCRKKFPVINLEILPAVLRGTGFPLLGTTPAQAEDEIVQALAEAFRSDHAGFYQRDPSGNHYLLLAYTGSLPGSADDFWRLPSLARVMSEETGVRVAAAKELDDQSLVLNSLGWSSALVVSAASASNRYLFLAARDVSEPVFQPDHVPMLELFARRAVLALENIRLWRRLSATIQKMERAGGLLPGAARMAALDKLFPGALSEVNNPLQSLKSNLYLAGRRDLSPERAANGLALAQKELYRLEGNFQHLQTLAQPTGSGPASLDLEAAAGRVMEVFQPIFREQNIQVRLAAARTLPPVLADRGSLEQALTFVLLNAVEALVGVSGDKLIYIDLDNSPEGPVLAVEDTGPGIRAEDAGLVFKPFFTTRKDHTGIGLSVTRQLLERQGGRLLLGKPVHGSGARFEFHLPISP